MMTDELFPETIIYPSELDYIQSHSLNYRDVYHNTLFDLLRALKKVFDRKEVRDIKIMKSEPAVEIPVVTFRNVDDCCQWLQDTYYETIMGKKFEPNVSSIQKIDADSLPEKFEVDLINIGG